MAKIDLILGELKEFKRATVSRLDRIEREVRALHRFKWKVAGGVSVLFVIVELVKSIKLGG